MDPVNNKQRNKCTQAGNECERGEGSRNIVDNDEGIGESTQPPVNSQKVRFVKSVVRIRLCWLLCL